MNFFSHVDQTTASALITGAASVLAAALGILGPKVHKSWKGVQAVQEQVVNGHDTNLRDDIDNCLEGISALLRGQSVHNTQIVDLRTDLEWERRERMDLARRMDRNYPPIQHFEGWENNDDKDKDRD